MGLLPEPPKLDPALVEHGSAMRAAIPVLPLPLAWLCCLFNIFIPGFGTLFSGILCLCIGKPRFSVRDDAAGRIGAFFIDLVIALGQAFTVLFCLVGWGWSIWWGVIMLRIARKSRKLAKAALEETASRGSNAGAAGAGAAGAAGPRAAQNHDVERGGAS